MRMATPSTILVANGPEKRAGIFSAPPARESAGTSRAWQLGHCQKGHTIAMCSTDLQAGQRKGDEVRLWPLSMRSRPMVPPSESQLTTPATPEQDTNAKP